MKHGYLPIGLIAVGLVVVGSLDPRPARGSSSGFRVIVSAANPASQMSQTEIASAYLGARRQWPDGEPVVVVDQSAKSPVRASFSQEVLGKDVDAVRMHWMKLIVAGRGRPPLTASEEDVLSMVSKDKRMVGYVSAEVALPAGVKVVSVRN